MRSTLLGLLLAASLGTAGAQEPAPDARDETAPLFTPDSDLASRLGALAGHPEGVRVPPAESVTVGDRRIPTGARVAGSVATADGDLHVFGEVDGDVLALDGDVVVHQGGRVRGDALAVSGRVRLEGGRVDGEMRMLSSLPTPALARAAAPSPTERTWRALSIAFGWLVMLALLGMGVLVLAGSYLDGVAETLSTRFAASFWTGLAGQLALLPALLVLSLALLVTVIGILLIPFAVVAFVLAVCGLLALGFLAIALVTGRALLRERGTGLAAQRVARLRAMLVGLVLFLGLWILAASFTWHPFAGLALRTIAVAVSWVAATLGFGATLLSRGGARRPRTMTAVAAAADAMAWQTPTPVSGVVAARRPTPAPRRTETTP
jgi:hypothetical protein